MGQIEKILTAADSLITKNPRIPIRYYAQRGMMVFCCASFGREIGTFTILFTMKDGPWFYYSISPNFPLSDKTGISHSFIRDREELIRKNKFVIFSGRNIIEYLQLGESLKKSQNGTLEDLTALCLLLKDNKKIIDAFSPEKIEETYNVLLAMAGNDEDEISSLIRDIIYR
ncbi:MAG: hypothetical protein WC593_09495 [Methanoregula sp.]